MRNSVYYLTERVRASRGGSGDTVNGSLSSASDAGLVHFACATPHLLEGGKKQQRQKKKDKKTDVDGNVWNPDPNLSLLFPSQHSS